MKDLEALVDCSDEVEVEGQPHALELSGLARRNAESRLEWFSEYTARFCRAYFTKTRLGDFYALAHDWANAYRLYEKTSPHQRKRPYSDVDHFVVMRLVDSLSVHFYRCLDEGTDIEVVENELKSQVLKALDKLLGVEEKLVSFWDRSCLGEWTRIGSNPGSAILNRDVHRSWKKLEHHSLCDLENGQTGEIDGWFWLVCRNAGKDPHDAILIDGRGDSLRDHSKRRSALFQLLNGYGRARESVLVSDGLKVDRDRQKLEADLSSMFWRMTNSGVWETSSAVRGIARTLIKGVRTGSRMVYLEFERNARREISVIPLFDTNESERNGPYIKVKIDQALVEEAVRGGRVGLSPDRVNDALSGTGLGRFRQRVTVLQHPSVKGGLLLEGKGRRPIIDDDVSFLERLVERFVPVWNQAIRLKALQDSIDSDSSPKLLMDRKKRLLFINRQAVERLGISLTPGWQENPKSIDDCSLKGRVKESLIPRNSVDIQKYNNITQRMPGIWVRECHPLLDGKRGDRGWVIIFRNRGFLFQSFDMISKLEAIDSVKSALDLITSNIKNLLEASSVKARIYLVERGAPNILKGVKSIGLSDVNNKRFDDGEVTFVRAAGVTAWRCLDSRKPEGFRIRRNGDARQSGVTANGLEFSFIDGIDDEGILERIENDLSLDFPLLAGDDVLGKLTLNFDYEDSERLPPDLPMQLGALSTVLGDLFVRLDRQAQFQDDTYKAMAETAHNILSEFNSIGGIIATLKLHEKKYPPLKAINDQLSNTYNGAENSIERIRDRVGPVVLKPDDCDLIAVLAECIDNRQMGGFDWAWERPSMERCYGNWDSDHWKHALVELIENSRLFKKPNVPLKLLMGVRRRGGSNSKELVITYKDNGRGGNRSRGG